jgi:hypothetical protein
LLSFYRARSPNINRGQLDDASRMYEAILARQPDHFDALHVSGVVGLRKRVAIQECGRECGDYRYLLRLARRTPSS